MAAADSVPPCITILTGVHERRYGQGITTRHRAVDCATAPEPLKKDDVEQTTKELRPVSGQPEAATALPCDEYCDPDCVHHVPSAGWDLSFGSRINFHPRNTADPRLVVLLNLSDDAIANGMVYRQVTAQQITEFAHHLLALAGTPPPAPAGRAALTDDQAVDRISAELAVDRALTMTERAAFHRHALVGQYDGAQPADWISESVDRDAYLDVVEPWMNINGEHVIAAFRDRFQLPEALTAQILIAALHAAIAIASATLGSPRRMHTEIAADALLWARGYAEAAGWNPPDRTTD